MTRSLVAYPVRRAAERPTSASSARRLLLLGVALCAAVNWSGPPRVFAQPPRPNVIVFLADDQGWGDLSHHGNTNLRTPNLDALARDGAAFERFYVCSVCAPTRAEFLTGRYHPRTGVRGVSTGQERLDLDERTIAESFRAAGYATGAFGKWHNGSQWPYHPNARGFDEYYGFTSGHWGEYYDAPLEHNGRLVRGSGFITDDLTSRALEFIERHRAEPFFCYVPYNVPHSPFCVPAEYWDRFRDKPITLRSHEGDRETVDVTRAALAMVENMDWNVGRVLQKLDELHLADHTIVVYFTDNGPNSFRWNGGMKGRKGSTDEGGLRSPLFIRWPRKIAAGRQVTEICGAIDLLPTLTSLAGIPRLGELPLDGRDVAPLLLATAPVAWEPRAIFSHWNGRVSCRTQQYRLDDKGHLFDMRADPGQTTDIARDKPDLAEKLQASIQAWRADVFGAARAQQADERPYPVGYAEFPWTPLPARDGVPHGQVRRSASAPNCSYFVNWKSTDDSLTWDVDVQTAGDYEVILYYTCPAADAGATIELSLGDSRLSGKVVPAWDPPLLKDQDVIPRPGAESIMKEFRPLPLGTIRLAAGRGLLTLRATEIPGGQVMDLRLVSLTLQR